MWKRLAMIVAALIVIFGLGLASGLFFYRFYKGYNTIFSGPAIIQKVQTLSQFVTVKYTLEKVIVYEDVKWYGDSRVVLVAHGVVKAGMDFSQLGPGDVSISGKKISLKLPRARITDVYLDDNKTQILDHSTGVFRQFDTGLEQSARQQAVDQLRLAASQSGILNNATDLGKSQLTTLLYQLGFTDVDLQTK